MKDRRLFPRAVLIAFCGNNLKTFNNGSTLTPTQLPNLALLVLYVPMTAVGYFELGEMARWAVVTNVKLILANLDQCVNDGGQKCEIARQDGGIVCALCDGGVKLMVEVGLI